MTNLKKKKKNIGIAGNCVSSQKLYFRILAAVWCLMSVVIAYSFSGNLTSYLVRPVYAPTINSFEELANSNTIHLTIEGNSILGKMFMVHSTLVNISYDWYANYCENRTRNREFLKDLAIRFELILKTIRTPGRRWRSECSLMKQLTWGYIIESLPFLN